MNIRRAYDGLARTTTAVFAALFVGACTGGAAYVALADFGVIAHNASAMFVVILLAAVVALAVLVVSREMRAERIAPESPDWTSARLEMWRNEQEAKR